MNSIARVAASALHTGFSFAIIVFQSTFSQIDNQTNLLIERLKKEYAKENTYRYSHSFFILL